ncbi:MAG TPA: N,N-dimethylformamidase beta subunit family domain-containing protein [Candidatus Acidoferrales bacterium]|nr:N,N-dimethylformamidase beta subunit family domain-containing protein [Candidatus Acidoferrales bacterium]
MASQIRRSRIARTVSLIIGVAAAVLIATLGSPALQASAAGAPCDPPIVNEVACENTLPGAPATAWDVTGAGDTSIQGFATDISVNRGSTISFKVSTNATAYRIDIYRLGYYGGAGARLVATLAPSVTLPQTQPPCLTDSVTHLVDCGNWSVSASWSVPTTAVSGVYIGRLVRTDTGGASHMVFIVRNDASTSALLFQTSDTTWTAYNTYVGNSLYYPTQQTRGFKVSYNRPYNNRAAGATGTPTSWLFDAEYPMIRWLEANGYDVTYISGVDTDRSGSLLLQHPVFLSVGHDEYWSAAQRANVEAARNAGHSLAFFSGDEVFWKTRYEQSSDASHTAYRTLVTYKETHNNGVIDPADPPTWTGTWRDPRFSPPADGGRPENALSGQIFMVNATRTDPIQVPYAEGRARFWRNTTIASQSPGQVATLPAGVLGFEWDEEPDNGFRPAGVVPLSLTTVSVSSNYLLDYGSTYGAGTPTHRMTLYRVGPALVFGAGTVRWSWGLDSHHDNGSVTPDVRMQQATVNLLADMGAQPATLQLGLVAASASTDAIAPTSTITSPANGSTLTPGTPITITGTAADVGGIVAAVEVSVDSGRTWHRATGRESWTYPFTPNAFGSVTTILSRAVDDSANVETPGPGVTVTAGSCGVCRTSLALNGTTAYAEAAQATELNTVGDWTIETWFKDETPGGYNHDTKYILIKGDTNANGEAPYLMGVSYNQLFVGARTGWTNFTMSRSLAGVTANAWHHAAATFASATRQLTLYLDGVQVGQVTATNWTTRGNMMAVEIGRNGSTGMFWQGKLDDVRIWNVVRTAAQISAGYQGELSTAPAGLVANWKFDEGAGTVAVDSAGAVQLHPATLQGAATWATDIGNGPPPPTAITSEASANVTNGSAQITWTTNNVADSQVEYGTTTAYGSFSTLDPTLVTGHSQQLTGLAASTTYHYRARSRDAGGTLAFGADATFTTTAPPPPTTISAVAANNVSNVNALISWSTNNPANSQVEYGTTAAYGSFSTLDATLVTTHSQQLSGLVPSTTYHYRVRSTDAGGTLVLSADGTFTTLAVAPATSLALNGSTAYAEAANAAKLNIGGDWTIETWFKDETPGGYNHDTKYILIKGDTNVSGDAAYVLGISYNQLFAGQRSGWSNWVVNRSLAGVTANAWHHAAATFASATRQLTLYLDGVQVAQATLGGAASAGNTLPLEIGRNGSTGMFWQGKLDDVRIWNVVRTAAQISAGYQGERSTAPAGLVANWQFDEGAGASAGDLVTPVDAATLQGAATWATDVHP